MSLRFQPCLAVDIELWPISRGAINWHCRLLWERNGAAGSDLASNKAGGNDAQQLKPKSDGFIRMEKKVLRV